LSAWLALAAAGTIAVWIATGRGAGISPDSVEYVAAARWLLAGKGLRALDGTPLIHFPPLYPVALAAAAWMSGSDPLDAARWLNAGLFGFLLALAGLLACRISGRVSAGLAAALVLLVSRDTVLMHAMAWSEPLAIVLGTAGLALLARHLETGRTHELMLAALALALATLTRYAAVAYTIAAIAALCLLDRGTLPARKLVKALSVGFAAVLPVGLWSVLARRGGGVGGRTLDLHGLTVSDLRKAAGTLASWVVPADTPAIIAVIATLVAVAAVFALVLRWRRQRTDGLPLPRILLLFAAVYAAFIAFCRMTIDAAILFDARILAPMLVVLVIVVSGLAGLGLPTLGHRWRWLVAAALAVLVGAQAFGTARWMRSARNQGLFYTRRGLETSPLLNRVRALPSTALVWSNAPDVIYVLTGRCVRRLPRRAHPESGRPDTGFTAAWEALLQQRDGYVAWFNAFDWRSYLPSQSELTASSTVSVFVPLRDGTLYRVTASPGRGVARQQPASCAPPRGARRPPTVPEGEPVEWLAYGGDPGGMRFSPLADINRTNVARLQLAWRWTNDEPRGTGPDGTLLPLGKFETTPLMAGDTLFLTTPNHRVVALDAESGAQFWSFDPRARESGRPRRGHRYVHRGLAQYPGDSVTGRRVFHASRGRLFALDAATGKPVEAFGDQGSVDLLTAMRWTGDPDHVDNTSPPTVYRDLVMVGSSISDDVTHPGDPRGAVLAFDAHTGALRWSFRTLTNGGHANVWAPMTVDTARGLLYLPVAAASNDYYGGRRPGSGPFAESLVCLDALTGRRKWHFQTVHHGLWDYDLPSPPVLATVRRGSRTQDVVAAASKTGFLYVFDRVTGTPVWPIEERPVPASDVPGEITSPTQPFPTRPAPFARQGFTESDLIDFTPRLRDSVRARLGGVRFGPLFTPPSLEGTVVMPGRIGGAPWGGAAYDPEQQLLYVKANNQPTVVSLASPGPPGPAVDARYVGQLQRGWRWPDLASSPQELPIGKPPYGTVTAIDLATGDHRWQAAVGHWPELEKHPELKGRKLPPLGAVGTSGGIVTRGGLVFISGGSTSLHALDAATGVQLWEGSLQGKGHANPMTYRTRGGRQYVVIATSRARGGELRAFALPRP
jgi:quinoprotein glucose dehydrogenase